MDNSDAAAIGRIVIADRDARQRVACLEQAVSNIVDQLTALTHAADTVSFNTTRFAVSDDGLRVDDETLVPNSAVSDLGRLIGELAEARTRATCTAQRMKQAGL